MDNHEKLGHCRKLLTSDYIQQLRDARTGLTRNPPKVEVAIAYLDNFLNQVDKLMAKIDD
jgi:hypothetical protein